MYAHDQYAALAGYLVGFIWKIPNVTRLYGTFLAELMRKPLVGLRYPVATAGFRVPSRLLICANDGTRGDEVARRLKVSPKRFRFWQNGVDPPQKLRQVTRKDFLQSYPQKLRPESKWILTCSRLSYWKRIDRILRAVRICRDQGRDCQLIVAGDGSERPGLQRLADDLGISGDVAWLGAVAHEEVWALMSLADVFVITNDVTNRCNPLYEAMCAGLPVVSIEDPSTADLLEDGVNALLTDKENTRELGQLLARACGDSGLAERMSHAQLSRSRMFWTWEERMRTEVRELEALVKNPQSTRLEGPNRTLVRKTP